MRAVRHVIRRLSLAAVGLCALALSAACANTPDNPLPYEDPHLDRVTASFLSTFESEREFRRYLRSVERLAAARDSRWARRSGVQYAMADEEPCAPGEDCPVEDDEERIVVTGSRVAAPPASITNNQESAVDEGDIVKQIGRFLLVLQDGRLFSIDTRPGGEPGLALVDRIDVYRDPDHHAWYDEMLVSDRRIVVTGYTYQQYATELTILAIDEDGRLTREDTFLMSSNDYYDADNYATRIVGDKFVVYSPIYLDYLDDWRSIEWPVVRRWTDEAALEGTDAAVTLFDARDIYRPLQRTLHPAVHTVSVCDIGGFAPGRRPDCEVTAFVGPEGSEFYVSEDDVFVWTWPGWTEAEVAEEDIDAVCAGSARSPMDEVTPTAIYRVPLSGAPMTVMGARGFPFDQFSMQSVDRRFRALVEWFAPRCVNPYESETYQIAYLDAPLGAFRDSLRQAGGGAYTEVPGLATNSESSGLFLHVMNRFTDDYVVYGGRRGRAIRRMTAGWTTMRPSWSRRWSNPRARSFLRRRTAWFA